MEETNWVIRHRPKTKSPEGEPIKVHIVAVRSNCVSNDVHCGHIRLFTEISVIVYSSEKPKTARRKWKRYLSSLSFDECCKLFVSESSSFDSLYFEKTLGSDGLESKVIAHARLRGSFNSKYGPQKCYLQQRAILTLDPNNLQRPLIVDKWISLLANCAPSEYDIVYTNNYPNY